MWVGGGWVASRQAATGAAGWRMFAPHPPQRPPATIGSHLELALPVAPALLLANHLTRAAQLQVALRHRKAVGAAGQHLRGMEAGVERAGGRGESALEMDGRRAAALDAAWHASQSAAQLRPPVPAPQLRCTHAHAHLRLCAARVNKVAVGLALAAPHAPPQLVQLRQAKALCAGGTRGVGG